MKVQNIKKNKDCHETALSYLTHRDRSAFQVESHLISKGFLQEEVDEELKYLKELRYVDDERYCEDYFQYAMRKGRGPVRIRLELKEKGIKEHLIQQALEAHFDSQTEKEAALKEANKLLEREGCLEYGDCEGKRTMIDEKILARIGRRLASLGYHGDIIYHIIGELRITNEMYTEKETL